MGTSKICGVAGAAGVYTAGSDKHRSYLSVSGPGPSFAANLDDYCSREITSIPLALPGVTAVTGLSCNPLPDQTAVSAGRASQNALLWLKLPTFLNTGTPLHDKQRREPAGAVAWRSEFIEGGEIGKQSPLATGRIV